jgi:hypothetical protein
MLLTALNNSTDHPLGSELFEEWSVKTVYSQQPITLWHIIHFIHTTICTAIKLIIVIIYIYKENMYMAYRACVHTIYNMR